MRNSLPRRRSAHLTDTRQFVLRSRKIAALNLVHQHHNRTRQPHPRPGPLSARPHRCTMRRCRRCSCNPNPATRRRRPRRPGTTTGDAPGRHQRSRSFNATNHHEYAAFCHDATIFCPPKIQSAMDNCLHRQHAKTLLWSETA